MKLAGAIALSTNSTIYPLELRVEFMMQEIPEEIEAQIKRWHQSAYILHSIYLFLGVS